MKKSKSNYFALEFVKIIFLFLFFSLVAFGVEQKNEKPLVDDQYRLSKDREELSKHREQIPEEKRKENDEVAFTLGLMSELRLTPTEVREKFNTAIRKKRDLFNKDMKKYREDFAKSEKQERDKFAKEIESERKDIRGKKLSSDQRKEFSEKIEAKRKDFYLAQREKREQFESEIRAQRKNFEDYAREKNNDFTQEHRAYSKRYQDFKKEKEDEKKSISAGSSRNAILTSSASQGPSVKTVAPSTYGITKEDLERAFQEAQSKPTTPLESGK